MSTPTSDTPGTSVSPGSAAPAESSRYAESPDSPGSGRERPEPRYFQRPARIAPPHESVPPDPDNLSAALEPVVDLLRGRRWAALTGAGMSTDSGIPDYRSPGSAPRSPMSHQQFLASPDHRRHYWARNHLGWRYMAAAQPNEGHRVLARLEEAGIVTGVITQNIDLLHVRAGSRRVVHVHGRWDVVRCLECGLRMTRQEHDELMVAANPGWREKMEQVPDIEVAPDADVVLEQTQDFVVVDCPRCGGILQTDVVFFGSNSSRERVAAATGIVAESEALVVLGSSLTVMGGLRYARMSAKGGTPVVIVNRGATRGDDLATIRLSAGTTQVLVGLEKALVGRSLGRRP